MSATDTSQTPMLPHSRVTCPFPRAPGFSTGDWAAPFRLLYFPAL